MVTGFLNIFTLREINYFVVFIKGFTGSEVINVHLCF